MKILVLLMTLLPMSALAGIYFEPMLSYSIGSKTLLGAESSDDDSQDISSIGTGIKLGYQSPSLGFGADIDVATSTITDSDIKLAQTTTGAYLLYRFGGKYHVWGTYLISGSLVGAGDGDQALTADVSGYKLGGGMYFMSHLALNLELQSYTYSDLVYTTIADIENERDDLSERRLVVSVSFPFEL